jgi:hypothetical protein
LRDVEIKKKTIVKATKQSMLRNFKQIYEQDRLNKVKNEFNDLTLKRKIR